MLKSFGYLIVVIVGATGIMVGGVSDSVGAGVEPPSVINSLVGSWRGTGTAKANSDSEPEAVNCKARYTLMSDDDKLRIEVTCASANGKGLLVGFIHYAENSSSVTGNWYQRWSTSEGEENGSLTGTISSADIVLDISAAGKVRARLTLSPRSGVTHHVEVVGIVDGEAEQGMQVLFRPR